MLTTARTAMTAALLALAVACGGGALDARPGNYLAPSPASTQAVAASQSTTTPASTPARSGTPVTLADVAPFAETYLRSMWNYLAGAGTARALYDLFTPECQRMVSLTSLERTPRLVQTVYRGLQGKSVEDVQFAVNLTLRAVTSGELELRLPLSSQTRFRVDGNWLTEYELVRQLNPAAAVDKADVLSITPSGDSFRIASCEYLRQWDRQ